MRKHYAQAQNNNIQFNMQNQKSLLLLLQWSKGKHKTRVVKKSLDGKINIPVKACMMEGQMEFANQSA